jgi:predicted ATPase
VSALTRIKLAGFKSIRDMGDGLEIRPLNVLIGANGSGKSNLASFFTLARHIVERNFRRYYGSLSPRTLDLLFYRGTSATQKIRSEMRFGCGSWDFTIVYQGPGGLLPLVIPDEAWDFGRYRHESEGALGEEAHLPDYARSEPDGPELAAVRSMESWRVYHFANTGPTAGVRQFADTREDAFLKPDGSNVAAVLRRLKERYWDHYRAIVDTVRMAAPSFDDFLLRESDNLENATALEWHDRLADLYFPPETWSDGTLRFICLATLLLQPNPPPLVILDEPELGLHPAALAILAGMLRSASHRTRIIACTQSASLVSHFDPEDVVVTDCREGASSFRRLEREALAGWLEEYALGQLWEKNVIEGGP